jgi:NTP pyrophosphatase (non-canonical NTP hydrolase)
MEEFTKFIKEVTEWQDKTFPGANSLSNLAHLIEEIVELKDAIVSSAYEGPKNHSIRMEYADCFLLLFGAASKSGFDPKDVFDAMREKMEINKNRKWGSPDENGVVRHIKD